MARDKAVNGEVGAEMTKEIRNSECCIASNRPQGGRPLRPGLRAAPAQAREAEEQP